MEETYQLHFGRRFAYGVGHVLNDLCASMWFSYLLVFFHYVVKFSNALSGQLMLVGQVADGLFTPLIGYESDRTEGFCKYGRRKSWHLVGVICVSISFPFLYMLCFGCEHSSQWAQFVYYAPMVVIFQFGWASTQISHLSLIPDLTANGHERVELNAIRYAFTVISSIAVYGLTWIILETNMTGDEGAHKITVKDAPHFRLLAIIVVCIGLVFMAVFHFGTKEQRRVFHPTDSMSESTLLIRRSKMAWSDWFKEWQFYQIAFVYMCTRLVVNLSQIYLPMYLTDSLNVDKKYIAIVPLVVYCSGFLASSVMKPVNRILGRKATFLTGAVIIIGNCVWIWFLQYTAKTVVFGPAVLLGIGGSTMLVTSLSMTADLIGHHTESGAFVYGAMSLTDKISNGVAVVLIQNMHPCKTESCCAACVWYYRNTMVFIPGAIAALAIAVLCTLLPMKIGSLRAHKRDAGVYPNSSINNAEENCCGYNSCFSSDPEPLAKGTTVVHNYSHDVQVGAATINNPDSPPCDCCAKSGASAACGASNSASVIEPCASDKVPLLQEVAPSTSMPPPEPPANKPEAVIPSGVPAVQEVKA